MNDCQNNCGNCNDKDYMTANQAKELFEKKFGKISIVTILGWIKKNQLGVKIEGKWWVDKKKFEAFLTKGN